MPWLSATTTVDRELAEPLSEALLDAGALSVDVSDADAGTSGERPIFDEPGGALSPGWARARVCALFADDAEVPVAMFAAFTACGVAATTAYEVTRVEDEDWVRRTQAQFTPQEVAPGLWIVPSWHAPPDPAATNIVLDPGLAFGTGTHPTTRLCLRWLARTIRGGERVIDFGCGSGILAIAAVKLGASGASGVDIDPQAVLAATRNAERNDVDAHFVSAAELLPGPADIVVANILAQPLIVLAPLLAGLTAPGGRLALSGILEEQAHEVHAAYGAWYDFDPLEADEGWVLVSGVRKQHNERT
jgi:ribosomal protein L11 methyltransferase